MIVYANEKGTTHPILTWQAPSITTVTGDINGDGELNVADAALLYSFVKADGELTESQLSRADLNGDGSVNILDAALLYKSIK